MRVNINDPKYRFEERVKRLVGKGLSEQDAKEVVETVIRTKEQEPYPELELVISPEWIITGELYQSNMSELTASDSNI